MSSNKQKTELDRTTYSPWQILWAQSRRDLYSAQKKEYTEILQQTKGGLLLFLFIVIVISFACGGVYNHHVWLLSAVLIMAGFADRPGTFIRQAVFVIFICIGFAQLSVPETLVQVPHLNTTCLCNTSTGAIDPLCVVYQKDIPGFETMINVTDLVCASRTTWEDLYRQRVELSGAQKQLQSLSTRLAKETRRVRICTKKIHLVRLATYVATSSAAAGYMGVHGLYKLWADTAAFGTILTLTEESTGEETLLETVIGTLSPLPLDMPTAQKPFTLTECFVNPYAAFFIGFVLCTLYTPVKVFRVFVGLLQVAVVHSWSVLCMLYASAQVVMKPTQVQSSGDVKKTGFVLLIPSHTHRRPNPTTLWGKLTRMSK